MAEFDFLGWMLKHRDMVNRLESAEAKLLEIERLAKAGELTDEQFDTLLNNVFKRVDNVDADAIVLLGDIAKTTNANRT